MFFNSTNDSDYGQTSLHRALLIFQMILGNLFSSFFFSFSVRNGNESIETRHQLWGEALNA